MSGNAQHEVIPLSKYLGTNSWSFDKGCGIRKWDLVENCDETFTENFLDKIKKAISKSRTRRGASFKVLMQSFSTLNSEDEFSPPDQLDVSNLKIVQNASGHGAALNSEEFSTSQTKPLVVCSSITKTNTTVLNPVSSSSSYDSKSQMKACELSDVLWNSLNDSRQYVNIEGLRCPKLLLTELATRYLNSSGLKDTALASVQTDLPKSEAPEISVGCQTEIVPPTLSDSRGRSEEINKSLLGMPPVEFANHQNFTWNKWNNTHDAKVQTNQTMYYPSYQHSVQSQSSQFRNYSGQHHQNTRINQTKLNAVRY
ncbi:unnamed protein product [Orchesella dallaii]|uniref:Uncharacterized protein n=1 Tax=Orchesella dallaii TaxID=48710 RepID=A0ABP1QHJ1_9HEXA